MKNYTNALGLELKNSTSKRYLFPLILVIICSLLATFDGVNDWFKDKGKLMEFQEFENLSFNGIVDYYHYSYKGIQISVMPSAASIFFNNPSVKSRLESHVNSIATLTIGKNLKDGAVIEENTTNRIRFSDIIYFLGSLLVIFYGFDAIRRMEYLKMQINGSSNRICFYSIITARFILITIWLILTFLLSLILSLVKGVPLSTLDFSTIAGYLIPALFLLFILFMAGIIIGSLGNKRKTTITLVTWFAIIFILPFITDKFILYQLDSIASSYSVHIKKHNIASGHDNQAAKEHGEFKNNTVEGRQVVVEKYWNNDFNDVEKQETIHRQSFVDLMKRHQLFMAFTPSSFYRMTSKELSSFGYRVFLDFFNYDISMQRDFLRFWIDRVYYNDPKVLVNFINGNENIYQAKSRLPYYYGLGIALNSFYLLVLLFIAYLTFKKSLYRINKKDMEPFKEFDHSIAPGGHKTFQHNDTILKNTLFNLLSGKTRELAKKGFQGKMLIDGKDISKSPYDGKFLYICNPDDVPSYVKVKNFLSLFAALNRLNPEEKSAVMDRPELTEILNKRFNKLTPRESFLVMHSLLSIKADLYLIDDIASIKAADNLFDMKDTIKRLKKEGSIVIYTTVHNLTNNIDVVLNANKSFVELAAWLENVEIIQMDYEEKMSAKRESNGD